MTTIHELAGIIAGVLGLLAYVPYIYSTIKGRTKPNRASWFIWTVVGGMVAGSCYASGSTTTLWVPCFYAVGSLATALISIKYGEGGWTRFDMLCLIVAGLSTIAWWYFSAIAALLINLGIDLVGFLPTLRKAHKDPQSENKTAWLLFFSANSFNLLAINKWSFAIMVYPLFMFFGTVTILAILFFSKKKIT